MLRLIRFRNLVAIGAVLFAMAMANGVLHAAQGLRSVAMNERALDPAAFRA